MRKLTVPISEEEIRSLRVGEAVSLNGVIVTARDAAHKYMVENFIKTQGNPPPTETALYEELKKVLGGGVIYHCGPVVQKSGDRWTFVAAGPTTSIRQDAQSVPGVRRGLSARHWWGGYFHRR